MENQLKEGGEMEWKTALTPSQPAQASMQLKALPSGEDSWVAYFEVHIKDAGKTG